MAAKFVVLTLVQYAASPLKKYGADSCLAVLCSIADPDPAVLASEFNHIALARGVVKTHDNNRRRERTLTYPNTPGSDCPTGYLYSIVFKCNNETKRSLCFMPY